MPHSTLYYILITNVTLQIVILACLLETELLKLKMDSQVGVSDMVLLDPLTEDALVENLKIRFKENKIYVSHLLSYVFAMDLTMQLK